MGRHVKLHPWSLWEGEGFLLDLLLLNLVPLLVELDHSYHLWRNKQTVSHNNNKMLICKQNKITFGIGGEVLGVDDFDLGLFGASLSESSAALNRLFGAWGTFFRELFIASSLS